MIGSNERREAARGVAEKLVRLFSIGVVLIVGCGSLFAADGPAAGTADFREKVMIAYGTVFAVLLIYLVLSHRKNSKVREEIELLEERIEELK
ncbi:MAG: hypothetical protein AAF488_17405 [Planctomycetota bacterium]